MLNFAPRNSFQAHALKVFTVVLWLVVSGFLGPLAARPALEVGDLVPTWIEPAQTADIEQVARTPSAFSVHDLRKAFPLSVQNTAWIRLRLSPNASQVGQWVLNVPLPFIDSISLFQRDAAGRWTEQKSGDQMAHSDWTHPSLTPAFHLIVNAQEPQEVYLRVRNYSPAYIPLRLFTQAEFEALQSTEFLVFGGVLGLLLTLCVISAMRFIEHRYPADLGAFAYGLLATLTIAQINGVLSMTVWQDFPLLANMGSKLISTVAVGGSLLYMRQLYALSVHYHRFDKLLGVTGAATIGLALAVGVLEPASASLVESTAFVFATFVAMAAALLSWRQRSPIWPWLMVATVPQSLCVLWLSAETFGLVLPRWEIRYITSLCIGGIRASTGVCLACGHAGPQRTHWTYAASRPAGCAHRTAQPRRV
jgi:hypothetical protein